MLIYQNKPNILITTINGINYCPVRVRIIIDHPQEKLAVTCNRQLQFNSQTRIPIFIQNFILLIALKNQSIFITKTYLPIKI